MQVETDVLIAGAGPAGICAALSLKKFGIPFIVIDGEKIGGLLRHANLVENFPFLPAQSGMKVAMQLAEILRKNKIKVLKEKAEFVRFNGDFFQVGTNKSVFSTRFLIAATGTKPRIPLIFRSAGNRLLNEKMPEVLVRLKGKKIAIVGAGDAAFDYAGSLSRRNKVFIFNRSSRYKCASFLFDRAGRSANVKYFANIQVQRTEETAGGLRIRCRNNERVFVFEVDYLLCATGRKAELSFLDGVRDVMPRLKSSRRLFIVGDARNGIFRQMLISMADGMKAAMEIKRRIEK